MIGDLRGVITGGGASVQQQNAVAGGAIAVSPGDVLVASYTEYNGYSLGVNDLATMHQGLGGDTLTWADPVTTIGRLNQRVAHGVVSQAGTITQIGNVGVNTPNNHDWVLTLSVYAGS